MDAVGIRAHVELDSVMNKVKLTGKIVGSTNKMFILDALITFALHNLKMAEQNGGILVPLNEQPEEKNNDFVYLEIMFKSMTDIVAFLERIKNEPS